MIIVEILFSYTLFRFVEYIICNYLYKPVLKFKRSSSDAIIPKRGTEDSAGYDLHSTIDVTILPNKVCRISTNISVMIPEGYYIKLESRSGLCIKKLMTIAGVIDRDYRGDIECILYNFGNTSYKIKKYDKISQAILIKTCNPNLQETSFLNSTNRGKNGFGSTGS